MGGGEVSPLPHQLHSNAASSKNKDEITVLVTGFGPFPDNPINSSHLITTLLPSSLAPNTSLNRTQKRIQILNPTSPEGAYVRVEYAYIRKYIRHLYDTYEHKVDLILHLGMADGWDFYSLERYAFKQGFTSTWWGSSGDGEGYYNKLLDAKGKTARDISEAEGRDWWDNAPVGLETSLDVDKVAARCEAITAKEPIATEELAATLVMDVNDRHKSKENRIIPHHEGGFYCCGFIYYESLATVWKRGLKTKILFTHVPGWADKEGLERGKDAVLVIIAAACEQIA